MLPCEWPPAVEFGHEFVLVQEEGGEVPHAQMSALVGTVPAEHGVHTASHVTALGQRDQTLHLAVFTHRHTRFEQGVPVRCNMQVTCKNIHVHASCEKCACEL